MDPKPYAALLLDDALSPVATWLRIYGVILQNGHQDSCKPLIHFLQVQLLVKMPQTFFLPTLIHHLKSILSHMAVTPVLGAPPLVPPLQGISAQGFQALVTVLCGGQTNSSPSTPGSSRTTVEKCCSVNLLTLSKLTHCTMVAELHPIWSAITTAPKSIKNSQTSSRPFWMITIEALVLLLMCLSLTEDLHNIIVNLMFWSGDPDCLDEGLHPLCTMYTSTANTSTNQMHLQIYNLLANDGNLDLQKIRMFQHIFKSDWPTSYTQLNTTLKLYLNLIVLLLKPTHPYTYTAA